MEALMTLLIVPIMLLDAMFSNPYVFIFVLFVIALWFINRLSKRWKV